MEWIVVLLVALVAAGYIAWPRPVVDRNDEVEIATLQQRRTLLLSELRDFDADLANGRISEEDRHAGRRALAPELREVTERLRALGEPAQSASSVNPD